MRLIIIICPWSIKPVWFPFPRRSQFCCRAAQMSVFHYCLQQQKGCPTEDKKMTFSDFFFHSVQWRQKNLRGLLGYLICFCPARTELNWGVVIFIEMNCILVAVFPVCKWSKTRKNSAQFRNPSERADKERAWSSPNHCSHFDRVQI